MKFTEPVASLGVTAAVKVTGCPMIDGLGLEPRVVLEPALFTV
jgi:hypothetical protein